MYLISNFIDNNFVLDYKEELLDPTNILIFGIIVIHNYKKNPTYCSIYCHIIFTILSIYNFYMITDINDYLNNLDKPNIIGRTCIKLLISYVILDLYFRNDLDLSFKLHHLLFAFSGIIMLIYGYYQNLAALAAIHEFSSLFLNLIDLNIKKELCKKLFTISFIFIRVPTIGIFIYNIKYNYMFCVLVGDLFLHFYWIYKQLKYMIKNNKKDKVINYSEELETIDKNL